MSPVKEVGRRKGSEEKRQEKKHLQDPLSTRGCADSSIHDTFAYDMTTLSFSTACQLATLQLERIW